MSRRRGLSVGQTQTHSDGLQSGAGCPTLGDTTQDAAGEPLPPLAVQRRLARTITNPAVNANRARKKWAACDQHPIDRGLLLELEAQIAAVQAGNLDQPTAQLVGQLESLDAVFYHLIECAYSYRGTERLDEMVILALKVHARVVTTVQRLAELKNPRPVAYVQQANIGNAVQVNNGPPAAETENPPNELLEKQRNEWMDRRAASAAVAVNQELETVGQIHRAKDGNR